MGHSYVEFRHKEELFNDGDLFFVMGAVSHQWRVAVAEETAFQRLEPLVVWWHNVESHPGPGCFDLKLNEHLRTQEGVRLLLALLDVIQDKLSGAGPILSPDYLNTMGLPDSPLYTKSVPAEHFIPLMRRFRAIVSAVEAELGT